MPRFLLSFPASALQAAPDELAAIGEAAHAVVAEARAAGALVFAGGIDARVATLRVSATGTASDAPYPGTGALDGGFTVLDLPSHEAAMLWAAKLAAACRCDQEVRMFGDDSAV